MFANNFPMLDLIFSKRQIAFIFGPFGFVMREIKPIGDFFIVWYNKTSGGAFFIDKNAAVPWTEGMGSKNIFVYDSSSALPVRVDVLKELERFRSFNSLKTITKKAKIIGDILQQDYQEQISKLQAEGKAEESNKVVKPDLQKLVDAEKQGQITKGDAASELLKYLEKRELLAINYPLDPRVSKAIDGMMNIHPAYVLQLLSEAGLVDFEHKKLKSAAIKGKFQFLLIVALALGIVGAYWLFTTIDFSGLQDFNFLPKFDLGTDKSGPLG